ncbi:MAG: arylesterase [Gammaproteobacteria bacterium]|nr:arylesterase [Gammaproteobacteria bacterium]
MHRYLHFVFLLLTGFAVYAQNYSSASILVVGDSLSAAYGMDVDQGWVSLLQQRLTASGHGHRLANASISGETTRGAWTRLPKLLDRYQPGIVIIELGGNDGLRGISLNKMQSNLEQMIRLCQQQGSRVLLLGMRLPPNYGPAYGERFHAVFKNISQQEGTNYLPFFLEGVAEDRNLMQADGIHPTQDAQTRLLDNVWPSIKSMLVSKDD